MNGGNFRQSVYRAIRHGLMQAHSMLLEPFYAFHLTIPDKMVGRAMTDLERRFAVFEGPVLEDGRGDTYRPCTGFIPGWISDRSNGLYPAGLGQLVCTLDGYGPCHNEEEVIEAAGYDPDADLANPSGSVFCSHGAGVRRETAARRKESAAGAAQKGGSSRGEAAKGTGESSPADRQSTSW
ncbi:MAG: hypothetical protein ACLTR6_01150 [Clostridium fessum]